VKEPGARGTGIYRKIMEMVKKIKNIETVSNNKRTGGRAFFL